MKKVKQEAGKIKLLEVEAKAQERLSHHLAVGHLKAAEKQAGQAEVTHLLNKLLANTAQQQQAQGQKRKADGPPVDQNPMLKAHHPPPNLITC